MNNEFIYNESDIATLGIYRYFINPDGDPWKTTKYVYYDGKYLVWIDYTGREGNRMKEQVQDIIREWLKNGRAREVDRDTAINNNREDK